MPEGGGAKLYSADWEADRAELLARRGHLKEALAYMEESTTAVASTDNYSVRQQNYSEFASLLLKAGDAEQALRFSLLVVEEAERGLASTMGETQRVAWERQ